MSPRLAHPLPAAESGRMIALGERLRAARRRRRLSVTAIAGQTGISRDTLHRLERGDEAVGLSVLFAVLRELDLQADLDLIAGADPLLGLAPARPARAGRAPRS